MSRIVKEFFCKLHGEFEGATHKCPHCGHGRFSVQEIRTAPAYRRPGKMAWIDRQARGIAEDAGLSDLRPDGQSGTSALTAELRKRELQAQAAEKRGERRTTPYWAEVPHAAAGFSKGGESPKVDGALFGTKYGTRINYSDIPAPRPRYVKAPE